MFSKTILVACVHLFSFGVIATRVYFDTPLYCDGPWRGISFESVGIPHDSGTHLVVAHCKHDLGWINTWSGGFVFKSVTIYTKCGYPVTGAPFNAEIITLPNLGREGYAWLYHGIHMQTNTSSTNKDVIFFMKDTFGKKYGQQDNSDFMTMLNTARSTQHFACGQHPQQQSSLSAWLPWQQPFSKASQSIWHDSVAYRNLLNTISYVSMGMNYTADTDTVPFQCNITFSRWLDDMSISIPSAATPVCYGGNFAVSVSAFTAVPKTMFAKILQSVSRGSNIMEGGFLERSYALLFMKQATSDEAATIKRVSTNTCPDRRCDTTQRGMYFGCNSQRK